MVALIAPILLICMLLTGSMDGTARGQAVPAGGSKQGLVQVGFVTQLTDANPSNLQNIFLNVVAVRLNPKPKGTSTKFPNESDPKWVTIPVPSGTGSGNGGRPGDLQIDLLAGRTQLQLFNTGNARIQTYHSVELELDTTNPGYVVPVCQQGTGITGSIEGCATAPLQLNNPGLQISFVSTNGIVLKKQAVTALPIQLNFVINTRPVVQGQPYVGTVTIAPAGGNFEAIISGSVGVTGSGVQKKKVRRLSVSAEPAGTNNVIAFGNVNNGNYSIAVPAPQPGTGAGASYDLFLSGGGVTYEAIRLTGASAVFASTQPITEDFTPQSTSATLGNISGTITDLCNNNAPLVGATLQLLIPPDSDTGANCSVTPEECVSVATANTDNAGNYPLPGTVTVPAPFANVPVNGKLPPYTLEITAPGYNTIRDGNVIASTKKIGGTCADSNSPPSCDYSLPSSFLKGTITLGAAPAPNTETMAQVFAENQGTNTLVSALSSPVIIRPGNNTQNFTLTVPSTQANAPAIAGAASLDLFAQAIDLYAGASDPYPGHTIITAANIAAPTVACQTIDLSATGSGTLFPGTETMDCVGHGSITGLLNNPDINTFVEISKNGDGNGDVQLFSAAPVSLIDPTGSTDTSPLIGNGYSFCVPPGDYDLTRYKGATPIESPVPTPGPTQAITVLPPPIPVPSASPSPCPSTCEDVDGSCPRICTNTAANPL
ncbi:MAG: hypothetical protein ACREQR_18210 [Candidatus Binataceae bacterium]